MEEMQKIGWGLIGASTIAHDYVIPAIQVQPHCQAKGVFSRSIDRGKSYAKDNGLPQAYESIDALLADDAVDAVYISTTNEKHKAQTLAAAAAGKHVLCEKPLALSLSDSIEMVAACKQAGVILGTNHHLRNAATHRKLRDLIKKGVIGQVQYARVFHAVFLPPHLQTWRLNNPDAGGGVVLDITVHDADTLRFVLDAEVVEVTAMTAAQGMAGNTLADGVMGVMRFDNGVLAQFHDSFTVANAPTGLEIHGSEGSLFAENVMTQQPVGDIYLQTASGRQHIPIEDPEDLYTHALRCFNSAIRGEGKPFATGDDGVKSLAIALAVRDAAATGQRITVQYQS